MESTPKIYVCGNDETICDGYTDERTEAWESEIAAAYYQAACRVIDDSGLADSEIAANFTDWRGGLHYCCGKLVAGKPWGYSVGLICCHDRDVPQELRDLIDAAEDAGSKARDEAIADFEETT